MPRKGQFIHFGPPHKMTYSKTLVCEHNSFWKHAYNPKHLYIKQNFRNHWLSGDHMTFAVTCYSSARHRSFIKLKLIRNVYSSCATQAEQVTPNPRFCCIWLGLLYSLLWGKHHFCINSHALQAFSSGHCIRSFTGNPIMFSQMSYEVDTRISIFT